MSNYLFWSIFQFGKIAWKHSDQNGEHTHCNAENDPSEPPCA